MSKLLLCAFMVMIFVACTNSSPTVENTIEDFLKKQPQKTDKRIFGGKLAVVQEMALDSLEVFEPYEIKKSKKYLFIRESSQISVIRKNDLKKKNTLIVKKGRGPGVISRFTDFDVTSTNIGLVDENGLKVAIWDHKGNLKNEYVLEKIRPDRITFYNNDSPVVFSTLGSEYVFNILDSGGDLKKGFNNLKDNNVANSLKITGKIKVYEDHIYFAGYSESILKKYDLEGNLIYSKSTIDDWPSDANYISFESGENQVGARYSPGALYAFFNFDVWDEYLVTIPHHNGDTDYKYLDIYIRENGDYLGTLTTDGYAFDVVVDDHFIFTRESEGGVMKLKKYKNELHQVIKN